MKIKHVYFIYDKKRNLVKIGSSFNPQKRFEYLRNSFNKYKLLYIFYGGGKRKETEFHIKFKRYLYDPLYHREWFIYSKEINEFISVLKQNGLVWIGHDILKTPKSIKTISFKTDEKTYNKLKYLGEKNGYSANGMAHYYIKIMTNFKDIKKI